MVPIILFIDKKKIKKIFNVGLISELKLIIQTSLGIK